MFYFAYAGHNIPPKRIEFGKIQKNPPGPNGGGTRISITGKTPEEKAVWQTLGEGNEDCVEWVVLCAALNLLEYVAHAQASYLLLTPSHLSDEIIKAADKNPPTPGPSGSQVPPGAPNGRAPVSLRDPGAAPPPGPQQPMRAGSVPPVGRAGPMSPSQGMPPQGIPMSSPGGRGGPMSPQGMPLQGYPSGGPRPAPGYGAPPPQGYPAPGPGQGYPGPRPGPGGPPPPHGGYPGLGRGGPPPQPGSRF